MFSLGFLFAIALIVFARGDVTFNKGEAGYFRPEGIGAREKYCAYLKNVQDGCGGGLVGGSCNVQISFYREVVIGCPKD